MNALELSSQEVALQVMQRMGEAADDAARAGVFTRYAEKRRPNTLTAQRGDLAMFAKYLATVAPAGVTMPTGAALQTTGAAWHGVTWGIVAGFVEWLKRDGYAVGTINRALATVKTYTKLAALAGVVSAADLALVRAVEGYKPGDGETMDAQRTAAGVATRRGYKKASHVRLTLAQCRALKTQPNTPQGRRDALLIALMLDHGLRESEAAGLEAAGVNMAAKTITFWRQKVRNTDTQHMTPATLRAMQAWIDAGECPALGPVLRSSRKGGELQPRPMTLSAIRQRVRTLGEAAGVEGLSPHDLRHAWAESMGRMVAAGTLTLFQFQEMGGWASLEMPRRYVARAAISNEGVQYADD